MNNARIYFTPNFLFTSPPTPLLIKERVILYNNFMYVITVFGDSITFGKGDKPNQGWCGRLKEYFESKGGNHRIYNLSISGDTTGDVLERFDVEAKARIKFIHDIDRHIILFSIGINDTNLLTEEKIPKVDINVFRNNIQVLIDKSKSYTNEIVFVGLTPVDESLRINRKGESLSNKRIEEFNNVIKKLCQKNSLPFLDMFQELSKLDYKKLLDDGLHPNPEGYQKMYELIKDFLIKNQIIN